MELALPTISEMIQSRTEDFSSLFWINGIGFNQKIGN